MVIRSVAMAHFRNHTRSEIANAADVNILTGRNGSGKTSVLEAIHLCSLARSFVPVPDSALVQHGEEGCTAHVTARRDLEAPYSVQITVREGTRKKIENSVGNHRSPRDLIGEMPVVALSPDHKQITFGAPADRRTFLDAVMAQSSRRYTDLLYEHRRVLKQRNVLLAEYAPNVPPGLDEWTNAFISISADIVRRRAEFVADVAPRIKAHYAEVSGGAEQIAVVYEPNAEAHSMEVTASSLRQRECQRGGTLFGPQKDELSFFIGKGLVKETASQGQHKSLLVALKIAECEILHEHTNERPVVLLDDVFSELDRWRVERVMKALIAMRMQCFVTTTEGDEISGLVPAGTHQSLIVLDRGEIVSETVV